jgi:hypothetical protein
MNNTAVSVVTSCGLHVGQDQTYALLGHMKEAHTVVHNIEKEIFSPYHSHYITC